MEESEDQVAVVGIGCNFPGGEGLESFWKVLVEGRNCSEPIPPERFEFSRWFDPDPSKAGKSCTEKAALIHGFNEFDHKFFGISEPEVDQMDPQQKQLLQCVYRALENAGVPLERVSGTRTGVFFGLMNRDYETNAAHVHPSVINHWTGTGLAMSLAANRVSYTFNLRGPSLSVDCACSSSLVALHLACQAIKQGDCELALCGGVSCILEPRVFVALSKAKMISPEGTSKPFSSRADGYGRGEGCGVLLLKPLNQAIKDHDHIWGLISKTAVNQDGRSVTPITKPSMTQQEELLDRIYSEADRHKVQYVEAHGTGTPVGDLTEAGSISNIISKSRPPGSGPLRVGSVKGNIGHTESAAGVAGLIKVLLMMKHETFVPTVHYSQETSGVDTKSLNIKISERAERWETDGGRTAGVNSFGFGGTNAHAIIRQHQEPNIHLKKEQKLIKYFVLSANSPKSLTLMVEDVLKQLDRNSGSDLDSLSYTSACRRSHRGHRYRKAVRVSSVQELQEKLKSPVGETVSPAPSEPRLGFVFCGNGVSYFGMCKELLKQEPVFREKVREVSEHFRGLGQLSVMDRLEGESEDSTDPEVVQPLLFAVQVGICSLLGHWGVRPDVVLGHSVGEVAAAHCSGLLSLEDAVKVIHVRSSLQSRVPGGRMLVISNMDISQVPDLLHKHSGRICIAAYNSPQSCTVSGDLDSIQSLQEELRTSADRQDLFLQVLDVPAAYHSSMMDPVLTEVEETIGTLQVNGLNTELFSTVTGQEVQQGDFCTGRYWSRNIREPVAFEQALRSAAKGQKNLVFVEIGPRKALQRNIQETLGQDTAVLPSVQPEKDHQTLTSVVSELFERGVHVDWDVFYRGAETRPLPFPKYQFDCSVRDVIIGAAQRNTSPHPVLFQTGSDPNTFSCDLQSESSSYLREHRHNNVPIIPGAFYAELGLAAFMISAKPKVALRSLQLSVSFHSPFLLTQNSPDMKVQLHQTETETRFTVLSSSATYASGSVSSQRARTIEEPFISLKSIFRRCRSVVRAQDFYRHLSTGGFQYGEVLQNKGDVHYGEDLREAYAAVTVPEGIRSQLQDFYIHPVVLDFLMQLLPVTVEHSFSGRPGFPSRIGSLTVCEPLKEEMMVYLRATEVGPDHFEVCGCFSDDEGRVLVEVKHVIIRYLRTGSQEVQEYFYHNVFSPVPVGLTSAPPPRALVFSDPLGISEGLKRYLDSRSQYIPYSQAKDLLTRGFPSLSLTGIEVNFDEVLFFWGKKDLTSLPPDVVLQSLVDCCEIFRQLVLKLKQIHFPNSIRTVTFCSSDVTVDHVNPGFALSGMVRSCAAEIPDLLFQLIDVHTISPKDTEVLSQVLRSCPCSRFPELVVKDGMVLKPTIVRTPPEIPDSSLVGFFSTASEPYVLQTADAHQMLQLSSAHSGETVQPISDTSVEIRPTKICVHTSDFFPVSESHLRFGPTLYWNKHSSQTHRLLVLDFSGSITAVGKSVRKLKVGDQVAICYPAVASSRIRVPEAVCYDTKRFPFLQNPPCVSYFVLAWEILNRALPRAKQNLGIISSESDSALLKVLSLTSFKSGWNVMVGSQVNGTFVGVDQIDAFIVLPPFDESLSLKICSFPNVQHVVFICDSQTQSLAQDVFHGVKERVHVQMVQVSAVLQKGSLSAQGPQIYRWMKSLSLSRKFRVESFTFQRERSESMKSLITEKPGSYFTSKRLSVVVLEDETSGPRSDIPKLPTQKHLFRKGALYVVSGGLSGLGFETVKFISQRGGGSILILSRSKPSPDVQKEICSVENQCGSRVLTMECDVSVPEEVNKVFSIITEKLPHCPIRGVFHSAVVLHDGLMESLDRSLYEKVLRPKVNGALNLHRVTQSCPLDHFVCFSSISAFLGNAAQTNYAAANTFLDMFCQYRRRLGLPGQSISWGALNLGLLLNLDPLQRFLEAKGMMVLEVVEFHQSLEKCLLLNRPQQAVCRFHFRNIRYNILSQNKALTLRLSALVQEAFRRSQATDSGSKPAEKVSPEEFMVSLLSETSGVDQSELKDERLLSSLGIDSLQAMTLQNAIFQRRGVNIPLVKLLDPTASLSTLRDLLREGEEDLCDNMNSAQSQEEDLCDNMNSAQSQEEDLCDDMNSAQSQEEEDVCTRL